MLYLLTAADLAAVGPGVLNQWKLELLTELYQQTLRHLAGEAAVKDAAGALEHLRSQLAQLAPQSSDHAWWERQIAVLPGWYLREDPLPLIRERLEQLHQLPRGDVMAAGRFVPERNAIEYTIGVHEDITPGIFHKLTGALTSKGKQILSASIAPLADGLVLDRFFVTDADFNGEPPQGRLDEVCAALVAALKDQSERPPTFRRLWQSRPLTVAPGQPMPPQRVRIDNNTAERYTILDIFAHDRMGLLYTITRTIFELGLSVHLAKIATYVDQVLDVFYVTENDGRKIVDEGRLKEIRARILEAIEQR
jgi:[protein-PII] uridylyltransferase